MQAYVETERLEGADAPTCERCKQRSPHSKRLQVYRPPRVLWITLKRFSPRNGGSSSSFLSFSRFRSASKNNAQVVVEDTLDLEPYCNALGLSSGNGGHGRPLRYQLIAVSHHSGSLEGGHYTATCRSCSDGSWYAFNDSSVRRDARPQGASATAYVLFYRLLPGGGEGGVEEGEGAGGRRGARTSSL